MRMYLDCLSCFLNQGLFAAREAGCSRERQKEIVDAIALMIPSISLDAAPPEIAVGVYALINRILETDDPFEAVKKASNKAALAVYPDLTERVRRSEDPLFTAVLTAISGNIIDYGANTKIDLKSEIGKIMEDETELVAHEDPRLFVMDEFRVALDSSREVLYIGDNAGEIVFDRVLVETLLRLKPGLKVRFAVRGRPIINDVTVDDARDVGMYGVCEVVSSGSPAPGAVPELCSPEFRELLSGADLVISKGQGNYEALSGSRYPIFFLLRIKCPVIAADIGAEKGAVCLIKNPPDRDGRAGA